MSLLATNSIVKLVDVCCDYFCLFVLKYHFFLKKIIKICEGVPKQVVCNTDVKCAYKMDPTTCQCVPAPCALTADRASAAVLACNAAGFRFDDSTCSCVKLCVSGDFAGVSIDAAVMRCSAANGVFVNTDGACSCKIPTSTCTTRTACGKFLLMII